MPGASWLVQMLPYLEQDTVAASIRATYRQQPRDEPILIGPNHSHTGLVIKTFLCPADPHPLGIHPATGDSSLGMTSYLGYEGTNYYRDDGVLFPLSAVRPPDIADGASNTLLLGERPAAPSVPADSSCRSSSAPAPAAGSPNSPKPPD